MKQFITVLLFATLPLTARATLSSQGKTMTMETIRQRLTASIFSQGKLPEAGKTLQWAETLGDDGKWPDINYQDTTRGAWEPRFHAERILALAQLFEADGPSKGDLPLREAFVRAVMGWDPDLIGPSWWWTSIGVPRLVAKGLLLMQPYLSEEHLAHGDRILERARIYDPAREGVFVNMVGHNLVWVLGIQIYRGILTGNTEMVSSAINGLAKTIAISEDEGIQHDFSFHQHGAQLYSLGYGLGFALDNANLVRLVVGTEFALSKEKIDLLTSLLLDGHAWFGRGMGVEIGAVGRNVARPNISRRDVATTAELLLGTGGGRDTELKALVEHIRNAGPPAATGNRHFYRSDIMVQHETNFYLSVKMTSSRTIGTECGNYENLLGDFLPDGATFFMARGDEYSNIFSVWDWRKIPGITSVDHEEPISTLTTPTGYKPIPESQSKNRFVGGVSDKTAGLATFDFSRQNPDIISAHKTWLCSRQGMTALVAGLSASNAERVTTSVNQCLLKGVVAMGISGDTLSLKNGTTPFSGPCWIYHDGFAYLFPADVRGQIFIGKVEGSWNRIIKDDKNRPATESVFSLWIDHGANPTDTSFTYTVLPATSEAEAKHLFQNREFRILTNTFETQAVATSDLIGISFYEPGRVTLSENRTIEVNQPCLILLQRANKGWNLSASNPKNEPMNLTVTFHRDKKRRAVNMVLPQGAKAGSTVSKILSRTIF